MGWFTRFLRSINLAVQSLFPILSILAQTFDRKDDSPGTTTASAGQHFFRALADLLQHPLRILILWNWKAAGLSIVLRGPIFVVATIRRGWRVTLAAVLAECFFCAVTAGFYGALMQNLRDAEPPWLTVGFFTGAVPAIFQVLEVYLHWIRGTPHLRVVESASVVVSAVSSLFNWYAMKRGTLLVGGEGNSFGSDLRRFPGLMLSFVAFLPRRLSHLTSRAANGPRDFSPRC
jgi:hypothetical protein